MIINFHNIRCVGRM